MRQERKLHQQYLHEYSVGHQQQGRKEQQAVGRPGLLHEAFLPHEPPYEQALQQDEFSVSVSPSPAMISTSTCMGTTSLFDVFGSGPSPLPPSGSNRGKAAERESEEEKRRREDANIQQIQNIVRAQMSKSRTAKKKQQQQQHQAATLFEKANGQSIGGACKKSSPGKKASAGRGRKKKTQTGGKAGAHRNSDLNLNLNLNSSSEEKQKRVKRAGTFQGEADIPSILRPNGFATLMDILPRVCVVPPPIDFLLPDVFLYNACLLPGSGLDSEAEDAEVSFEVLSQVFGKHLPRFWSKSEKDGQRQRQG